jgi:hypothetical protein
VLALSFERAQAAGRRHAPPLFRSFWLAGFDAADHLPGMRSAADGFAIDYYRARVGADYDMAAEAGIRCVRESIGWRRIARRGGFDFETVVLRAESARRAGLQVVWTLCHDGWPDDVDVCSDEFVDRFRELASAAARVLAPSAGPEPPIYTPINEISFLAWALTETGLVAPPRSELRHGSYALKRKLACAAFAACDAIRAIDPRARFLHVEPETSVAAGDARARRALLFRALDMLTGRLEPEHGGNAGYVDVVGIHCHRGAHPWRGTPDAASRGIRETPPIAVHRLLADVHARYGCPIVVAESSPGPAGRVGWLREIGEEIGKALERGVPIVATCLSRVVERPAWEDPRAWRGRRLWDVLLHASHHAPRVRDSAYEQALRDVRSRIDPLVATSDPRYSP